MLFTVVVYFNDLMVQSLHPCHVRRVRGKCCPHLLVQFIQPLANSVDLQLFLHHLHIFSYQTLVAASESVACWVDDFPFQMSYGG